MKKVIASLMLACAVFSAQAEPIDVIADGVTAVATSTTTFAVCKVVDIASTAYLISNGLGVEANPIVAGIIGNGYLPLIAVSVLVWYMLTQVDSPAGIAVANVVTCGVAAHNLTLL